MTAPKPYAEQCTRVYTRTGTRAHLMSPVQSIRNGSVLCARVLPEWFTEWYGTGSQDEIDRAASLPLCKHCEDQARREDEYYGELPQFNPPDRADRIAPGPAAHGSAAPDADPAGVSTPPLGAPAQTPRQARAPQLPAPDGAGAPSRATPRSQALRDGTREGAAPEAPAGGAPSVPSVFPAGSRGLRGKAALDAISKAQSDRNAAKRRGRVRRAPKQAGPGMIRRAAPETPGGDAA